MSAEEYAEHLLASLDVVLPVGAAPEPIAEWAGSGAMALTGRADGPPLVHAGVAMAARGALLALAALAPGVLLPDLRVLSARAAAMGLRRSGGRSCGGSTRLLPAADGPLALTLSRQADLELVPALVESQVEDPWGAVKRWLSGRTVAEAAERLQLLGLPYGVPGETAATLPWVLAEARPGPTCTDRPLVVNLASLWAGPLCAMLLGRLGCRVVSVASATRPDRTRQEGAASFLGGQNAAEQITLNLHQAAGRQALQDLLLSADVVIEGSRPRALQQLGSPAEHVLAQRDHLTWVSITGHGRGSERVAFGDDAAVAGGLILDGCFVADAVADPLTGLHAALAAWAGLLRGGNWLVEVPLARVAATAASLDLKDPPLAYLQEDRWWVNAADGAVVVEEP